MSIKEKLSALGLTLPTAAAPVAAYVPAVKSGNLVFTAGQLPVVDGKLVIEGKVGSDVTADDAKELAQLCALNALAAISLIAEAIAETKAAGPAGMGLVMKVLQPKIAGKADGGVVSSLVKAALSQ